MFVVMLKFQIVVSCYGAFLAWTCLELDRRKQVVPDSAVDFFGVFHNYSAVCNATTFAVAPCWSLKRSA
jgi:hypothetical protein